jgi:hypothetical protein
MGFSWVGFAIAVVLILPSIIFFTYFPPIDSREIIETNKVYTILERVGQIGSLTSLVISKDYFLLSNRGIWFYFMLIGIILYWILWIRYVIKGRETKYTLMPFMGIPIPLAVIPVCIFISASLWGDCIWLVVFGIIFAIGHLKVTWNTYVQVFTK